MIKRAAGESCTDVHEAPGSSGRSVSESATLLLRLETGTATVGVVGLGYVGLPLVGAIHDKGYSVLGFDTDGSKVDALNAGRSYIRHIPDTMIEELVRGGRFIACTDFSRIGTCDVLLICVPTPLTRHREPDMTHVVATVKTLAPHLRKGQLVVLESTTYPGTTTEILRPILEAGGLKSGEDFFLAYSPEREDPGNPLYDTRKIPKVVGGDGATARTLACAFYGRIVAGVVPVSSTATAEAVKLTENIFRSVNIALVNELKIVFDAMGIDVWEVIDAAKTKPFGFMPFYPGPGLGGHCIPIDPFYLTWKAREFNIVTRFIELAGEINTAMPAHVIRRLAEEMDARFGKGLKGAKVLVLGIAYKKNVDDDRESPAYQLMTLLRTRGAGVAYFDPLVPVIRPNREHPECAGMHCIPWTPESLAGFDAALICTDHDGVDYAELVRYSHLVVDTRNATCDVFEYRERIVKA
ncbi:MAG: UDP-N-acetyl-D-glucosamine dehydrogenase [Rhodospirillaceae bacterium]|nr:MAG: UDP-N-acetyl-D-glucosamine dehydrogenase [Rhodospirillaceae bacterium]